MRQIPFGLVALLVLGLASVASEASADPLVYVGGVGYAGECPSDAQMPAYERQYSVTPSLRCMYDGETDKDAAIKTLQGTQTEADDYLNTALAAANGWHSLADPTDDWVGLLQNPLGFTWTVDDPATNDSGTFTIDQSILQYDQFAIGIKDGAVPFWAIFELGVGQLTGDWGFSTEGGNLSHFALYGRFVQDDPPVITETPEPASLLLMGAGLAVVGKIRSRRKKQ